MVQLEVRVAVRLSRVARYGRMGRTRKEPRRGRQGSVRGWKPGEPGTDSMRPFLLGFVIGTDLCVGRPARLTVAMRVA
jgi:hypothetical protein